MKRLFDLLATFIAILREVIKWYRSYFSYLDDILNRIFKSILGELLTRKINYFRKIIRYPLVYPSRT